MATLLIRYIVRRSSQRFSIAPLLLLLATGLEFTQFFTFCMVNYFLIKVMTKG